MTEELAAAVRRAQTKYRLACTEHRVRDDEESRLAMDRAARELDEVQRAAIYAVEEVRTSVGW